MMDQDPLTYADAYRRASRLKDAIPPLRVQVVPSTGYGWVVRVLEPGTADWITLPDALSVQAYLDARRGSRGVAGAPDFGKSGL